MIRMTFLLLNIIVVWVGSHTATGYGYIVASNSIKEFYTLLDRGSTTTPTTKSNSDSSPVAELHVPSTLSPSVDASSTTTSESLRTTGGNADTTRTYKSYRQRYTDGKDETCCRTVLTYTLLAMLFLILLVTSLMARFGYVRPSYSRVVLTYHRVKEKVLLYKNRPNDTNGTDLNVVETLVSSADQPCCEYFACPVSGMPGQSKLKNVTLTPPPKDRIEPVKFQGASIEIPNAAGSTGSSYTSSGSVDSAYDSSFAESDDSTSTVSDSSEDGNGLEDGETSPTVVNINPFDPEYVYAALVPDIQYPSYSHLTRFENDKINGHPKIEQTLSTSKRKHYATSHPRSEFLLETIDE